MPQGLLAFSPVNVAPSEKNFNNHESVGVNRISCFVIGVSSRETVAARLIFALPALEYPLGV